MLYSFSLKLFISLSLTFAALTLNLKIKRVSFDLDSNETSNTTQKRLQIHHDYRYYIKHYAVKPKKKKTSLSLRASQLSGGLRGRGKNPLLQHAV